MPTLREIKSDIGRLSRHEAESLAIWLQDFNDNSDRVAESVPADASMCRTEYISVEDYLKLEEGNDVRHEYIHGVLYAMSGVTERHSLIAGNVFSAFHHHLRGGPCKPHIADFKLRLEINRQDILSPVRAAFRVLRALAEFARQPPAALPQASGAHEPARGWPALAISYSVRIHDRNAIWRYSKRSKSKQAPGRPAR